MKEYIGKCEQCGTDIYCFGGFFTGIIVNQKLFCISCYQKLKDK